MSDETTFGERARVHLQSSRSSDGLRVLLWGDAGMQGFEIDFRARAPVHMPARETDGRGTCWSPVPNDVWPLTRGPALPTRIPSVVTGVSAVYHATIDGVKLTIEIARDDEGWKIRQAKQVANGEPTVRQWDVLRRWESQLG